MSVFVETAEILAAIKRVLEHAEKIENYYYPGRANFPGKDPKLNLVIASFRMTYSLTAFKGQVYKHLSVSVARKGHLPHPDMAMRIGELYGLVEKPEAPVRMAAHDDCVIMVQRVPKESI